MRSTSLCACSLADFFEALISHFPERALNRFALGIEDTLLEGDINVSFHGRLNYTSAFLSELCGLSFAAFAVKGFFIVAAKDQKILTAKYAEKEPQSTQRGSNALTLPAKDCAKRGATGGVMVRPTTS
jgi:hypothetical protein